MSGSEVARPRKSDTLGHRSVTVTAEIYRHPITPVRSGHVAAMDAITSKAKRRPAPTGRHSAAAGQSTQSDALRQASPAELISTRSGRSCRHLDDLLSQSPSCLSAVSTASAAATTSERSGSSSGR